LIAILLAGQQAGPGDADIAVLVQHPGAVIAFVAVVLVGDHAARQEIDAEMRAIHGCPDQGVVLHDIDEVGVLHQLIRLAGRG
jgi:hypothetical protein